MKTSYALLAMCLLILVSCKEETTTVKSLQGKNDIDSSATDIVSKSKKSAEELKVLLSLFTEKKHKIQEKLKSLSPEQANKLYESYLAENTEEVMKVQNHEGHLLETNNYFSYFYNDKGESITPPDSIAVKKDLLNKAGLEFWEIGEGYTDIRTQADFYLLIFENYVTNDYRDFLRINAEEDKVLYSADGGLAVSFNEVGKRILNWEKFIHKYPNSTLLDRATEMYTSYQLNYLFGEDNTPTMEYPDTKLYPENIAEFNNFISQNPDSFTSKLVKIVLETTKNYDALKAEIMAEQTKYNGK
ncbi:hypothetical protein [Flavobacterium cerinum]|uniref:Lipoprotein n=1 Tax=Flavobacterium cerinum TaxID=2502784 RepID=A0A444GM64_9FLAO|nr:hypothetical protein [Flavobacterium cerinum]RWW92072.1 hypothetical protein EPI11_16850 [Flavobacterium cerinum]